MFSALWAEIQGADEEKGQRGDAEVAAYRVAPEEAFPTGSIIAFAGEASPRGWLFCDGREYSSREYPRLWEVIKMKYVPAQEELRILRFNADEANGYKLFYVPDLRGRVVVGVDGGADIITSNNTLGAFGGEEQHQLTVAELPSHNHEMNLADTQCYGEGGKYMAAHAGDRFSTKNSGGNQPHNNMQPYQVLNYIISTGKMNNRHNDQTIDRLQQQISELNVRLSNISVQDPRGCAKAWVIFNGVKNASILDSYGVSSVVRGNEGVYTIKFFKPFNSEFYGSSFTARFADWGGPMSAYLFPSQTCESVTIATILLTGDYADAGFVSACFYGNQ